MVDMTQRECGWCKKSFVARTADVNRGWAKFCSKSCKAMKQEKKTGQYARHCSGKNKIYPRMEKWESDEVQFENDMDGATAGWDEGGWLSDDSGVSE